MNAATTNAPTNSLANTRTATALHALMQMWEETADEDQESETELMVMLSGMVGSHATQLDGE
jgi:hypothetical protein